MKTKLFERPAPGTKAYYQSCIPVGVQIQVLAIVDVHILIIVVDNCVTVSMKGLASLADSIDLPPKAVKQVIFITLEITLKF